MHFQEKVKWLRSACSDREGVIKGILKSRSSESGRSKSSGSSRKSQSSHARELEEKARIAELMAEAEYNEQRQYAENQAEMLKIQQQQNKSRSLWPG